MRSGDPVEVVRDAFQAFLQGDLEALREMVTPDFEWTFLDPSDPDAQATTCHGRDELERFVGVFSRRGLSPEIEELDARGDTVVVVLHVPGLDQFRARHAEDRNFHVVPVRDGQVQSIRACHDRSEARSVAGFSG